MAKERDESSRELETHRGAVKESSSDVQENERKLDEMSARESRPARDDENIHKTSHENVTENIFLVDSKVV